VELAIYFTLLDNLHLRPLHSGKNAAAVCYEYKEWFKVDCRAITRHIRNQGHIVCSEFAEH